MALEPKPGFDWSRLLWSRHDVPVSNRCSYCLAPIPEEAVPLRMWNERGDAIVFCDGCGATWWGLEPMPWDDDYDA